MELFGSLLSIGGFGISIWQIYRTRTAAEAARAASVEAVSSLKYVTGVANIQNICGRSRELLHLTRARNLVSAATTAFELRDLVARFFVTESGKALATPDDWSTIRTDLCSVHERLESAAITKRLDIQEREQLLHEISRLHTELSAFSALTTNGGQSNANPS